MVFSFGGVGPRPNRTTNQSVRSLSPLSYSKKNAPMGISLLVNPSPCMKREVCCINVNVVLHPWCLCVWGQENQRDSGSGQQVHCSEATSSWEPAPSPSRPGQRATIPPLASLPLSGHAHPATALPACMCHTKACDREHLGEVDWAHTHHFAVPARRH